MKRIDKIQFARAYLGVILLTIVLCLGFASSTQQSLPPVKQFTNANLIQSCQNSTYSNITRILLPNQTFAINGNISMTSTSNSNYNYTFTQTSLIGDYIVYGNCDENGLNTPWVYDFIVNANGIAQTTAQGIGSAIYLVLILVLTILFGWMGFKLSETKSLWVLGIFLMFLSVLLVTYDVWLGVEYYQDYTGNTNTVLPTTIFYIFMTIVTLGLLVSLFLLFTRWRELAEYYKREMRQNKDDEFDLGDDMQ